MPNKLIAEAKTPDGEAVTLSLEGQDHVVRIRGELLMSSRQTGSEQAMAALAFEKVTKSSAAQILIGGLGMGFTLRAVLDLFGPESKVTVLEIIEEIVQWNHVVLAHYASHALEDPRVTVKVDDIINFLLSGQKHFDAIILDIDNGPEAFTVKSNDQLYSLAGLGSLYDSLLPGGVLVLWSAFKSVAFEKRLKSVGFVATTVLVRATTKARKGKKHTVFVAVRPH